MPKLTKQELDERADWDFETLARAEEIKADKARLNRATRAGRAKVKKNERVLKSVKGGTARKTTRKK